MQKKHAKMAGAGQRRVRMLLNQGTLWGHCAKAARGARRLIFRPSRGRLRLFPRHEAPSGLSGTLWSGGCPDPFGGVRRAGLSAQGPEATPEFEPAPNSTRRSWVFQHKPRASPRFRGGGGSLIWSFAPGGLGERHGQGAGDLTPSRGDNNKSGQTKPKRVTPQK